MKVRKVFAHRSVFLRLVVGKVGLGEGDSLLVGTEDVMGRSDFILHDLDEDICAPLPEPTTLAFLVFGSVAMLRSRMSCINLL